MDGLISDGLKVRCIESRISVIATHISISRVKIPGTERVCSVCLAISLLSGKWVTVWTQKMHGSRLDCRFFGCFEFFVSFTAIAVHKACSGREREQIQ